MNYLYYFQPRLECLCIASVVRQLLKQKDTGEAVRIYMLNHPGHDVTNINFKIKEFQKNHLIPVTLINKMRFFAPLMLGTLKEWLKWGHTHFNDIPYEIFFQASYLTNFGTIDQIKSVIEILNNRYVDFEVRFRLACITCLETYVEDFWPALHEEELESLELLSKRNDMYLLAYWMNKMKMNDNLKFKKRICLMSEPLTNYFEKAMEDVYELAALFFWNNFSLPDKLEILNKSEITDNLWCARPRRYVHFLLLVLPHIEQKQRIQWIISNIKMLLIILQFPPWRLFYRRVVKKLLEWIEVANYAICIRALMDAPLGWDFRIEAMGYLISFVSLEVSFVNNRQVFYEIIFGLLKAHESRYAINFFKNQRFDIRILFSDEFVRQCYNNYAEFFDEDTLGSTIIFIVMCVDNEERRVEWIDKFVQEAQGPGITNLTKTIKRSCMSFYEVPVNEIPFIFSDIY